MAPTENDWAGRVRRFLDDELWFFDLQPRSLRTAVYAVLQFVVMVSEGFVRDQLLLRASALTTMAMLSLVPLMALMLAIAGAIGVSDDLAVLAIESIAGWNPELQTRLLEMVASVKFGALGTVGAATLLFTTVLALRHGEQTLNDIWGVVHGRSWTRRFADYLAVLVVAPISMGVAISLASTLQSASVVSALLQYPAFDLFYSTGLRYAPVGLHAVAFTFLYWFLPNTQVRFFSAVLGGLVAATLLTLGQGLYVEFSVNAARTNVLFGTLAQIPLLITWIYLAMSIGLLGAEISFAHQNLGRYRREVQARDLEPAEREALALCVALEVARAFRCQLTPWSGETLADQLAVPVRTVRSLLQRLEQHGRIVVALSAEERDDAYQLGRPASDIRVHEVLEAVRGEARLPRATQGAGGVVESVAKVIDDLARGSSGAGGDRNLAELLDASAETQANAPARIAHGA